MSGPHATARPRLFDAAWLNRQLPLQLPPQPTPYLLCVAWSGGADSTALLAALAELRRMPGRTLDFSLRAVHVDHHLQAASTLFRRHCQRLARALHVPLRICDAHLPCGSGRSLEELAREARYALLAATLRPGEILLTGQHAEDQLETVLLQLLRGAGVAGMAGMAGRSVLGRGLMLRPLLSLPGQSLRDYLNGRKLAWIEDPSNAEERFDRNYLRAQVLPRLLARWPAAARTVARAARHAAEADASAGREARLDAAAAADGTGLDLAVLRRFSPQRQRAALRAWILARGLPLPDERRLAEVQRVIDLRADARPRVQWQGVELRRHAGRLCVQAVAAEARSGEGSALGWSWRRQRRLMLPGNAGYLQLRADPWGDVDCARLPPTLAIEFRRGGERVPGAAGHRDVKSLLREAGIPEWQRAQVPFICAPAAPEAGQMARLLAIGDLWVAPELLPQDLDAERGRFIWQPQ